MLILTNLVGFGAGGEEFGPAQTGWSTTLSNQTTGYENYSSRVRITSNLLAGGTQIRVRFVASTAATFACDNCSIGIGATNGNTASTPVELLFSGVSGFSIAANNTLVSDWVNLTTTTSDQVVVVMDHGASNGNPRYSGAGATHYASSASNSYNSASPGYSASGLTAFGFDLIEVR